jgi:renalase
MRSEDSPRIAVVGAGVSGLTCARELTRSGLVVNVFEKARGSGGRSATRRAGDYHFDHGAQYFTVRDQRFAAEVEDWTCAGVVRPWTGRIVELVEGGSTAEKSESTRYVGVPGMTAPARALAAEVDVRWRARVRKIERDDASWRLILEGGEAHEGFSAVVVSAPAPQSADMLRDVTPRLAAACGSVVMQPCWSVMAAFDQPVGADFDGAFINGRDLAWVARNSGKPGRPSAPECWVLQAGPEWSRRSLERDGSEVAGALLASFFAIGAWPFQEPLHLDAHRWRFARTARRITAGCLFDAEARVVVCGDWLCGDRIEGAFLSGLQAARELLTIL